MPRGLAPATCSGGGRSRSSHAGAVTSRSGPNLVTPSLSWLTRTYRTRDRRSAPSCSSWPKSLTTAIRSRSTSSRSARGDLVHPPAAVRRADPQGPVDAQRLRAERAPVQEDVLAGVRAQALAEEHYPRPRSGPVPQALQDPQPQQPVLFARVLHLAQRQRRRPLRVLHRHGGDVAPREVLGRRDRDVVDVAGAGGRDQHDQRTVERAGPLHLGQRQVHPLARWWPRCPGRRRPAPAWPRAGSPMHGLDGQVRHARRPVDQVCGRT